MNTNETVDANGLIIMNKLMPTNTKILFKVQVLFLWAESEKFIKLVNKNHWSIKIKGSKSEKLQTKK